MNALAFSGTIEANFHTYRIHGDGGDETLEVEPLFTDAADGRNLFHSPGGRDFVIACGFLDQVVDLTLSYSQDPPTTTLEQDRLGYDHRLWSRCEESSALLAGQIFLRNDDEEFGERGSVSIGSVDAAIYRMRLLTRATTAESQPPAQHIIRVWPVDSAGPWQTARYGYPPIDEVTWD